LTDRAGQPLRSTPHDFRRIFAINAYLAAFRADLIQFYLRLPAQPPR
jgi:hypothetical protein